jgi:hypothetical protein
VKSDWSIGGNEYEDESSERLTNDERRTTNDERRTTNDERRDMAWRVRRME